MSGKGKAKTKEARLSEALQTLAEKQRTAEVMGPAPAGLTLEFREENVRRATWKMEAPDWHLIQVLRKMTELRDRFRDEVEHVYRENQDASVWYSHVHIEAGENGGLTGRLEFPETVTIPAARAATNAVQEAARQIGREWERFIDLLRIFGIANIYQQIKEDSRF